MSGTPARTAGAVDFSRVSRGMWVSAIGAIVLLISVFFDWYSGTVSISGGPGGFNGSASKSVSGTSANNSHVKRAKEHSATRPPFRAVGRAPRALGPPRRSSGAGPARGAADRARRRRRTTPAVGEFRAVGLSESLTFGSNRRPDVGAL